MIYVSICFKYSGSHMYIYFQSNFKIKELDLSHNEFCGKGGEHIGQMLGKVQIINFNIKKKLIN